MNTLPIIGRSPAAVISRARMLGFECWPYRAERRANGTWVHYYRKDDQKAPPGAPRRICCALKGSFLPKPMLLLLP